MNSPLKSAEDDLRVMTRRVEELKETIEYLQRELKHTRELLNVAIKSKRVCMALSD